MTDRPTVRTKTAHVLPADFDQLVLKTASCQHLKMMKTKHFSTLSNEAKRFLRLRYISHQILGEIAQSKLP